MHSMRNDFLTHTRFTCNQYRPMTRRDRTHLLADFPHRRRFADDAIQPEQPFGRFVRSCVRFEDRVLLEHRRVGDRTLDRDDHLIAFKRLGDVVVRAVLHRLDSGLHCSERGHQYHRKIIINRTDLTCEIHACHSWHIQICQHHIRTLR